MSSMAKVDAKVVERHSRHRSSDLSVFRIAILETGAPASELVEGHGSYADMLQRFMGAEHSYSVFDTRERQYPKDEASYDAWFITGSAAGVNDGLPWIDALAAHLRHSVGKIPIVGICFGHQILAAALGGVVDRSAAGWKIGRQIYLTTPQCPWEVRTLPCLASHRDQVLGAPESGLVILRGPDTPCAGIYYPSQRALSFQFHPEFTADFTAELLRSRRGTLLTEEQVNAAISSMGASCDNETVRGWISEFVSSGGRAPSSWRAI